MAGIAELTDLTFGDVVFKTATPVLVEFWAPWSKACRLAGPGLEAAAAAFGVEARPMRLNVEENPIAATVYGVRHIPTCILFRSGEELDQWAGALDRDEIVRRVRAACSGGGGT